MMALNEIILAFALGAMGGVAIGLTVRSRRSDVAVDRVVRTMGKKVERARRALGLARKVAWRR